MNFFRLLLVFSLATSSFPNPALAADLNHSLDGLFSPLATEKTPGFAVLVRSRGKVVFQKGYGVRDLRTFAKFDPRTNVRLASFTKQFTAMAVMLLVHDGKLRYDQTLTSIFSDFPAYGSKITVRHLLTHTSGLPDYEDLMDETQKGAWTPAHQIQDDDVLRLLKQAATPKFNPGTSWSYSNSGYVLLGLIVARASGQSFGDFLQSRIFRPLHMDRTIAFRNGVNTVPDRAYGHSRKNGEFVETDQSSTSATLGDGGIYSNLEDLARWDQALDQHSLLSQREMSEALQPAKLADGSLPQQPKPTLYGFGWFLDPYQSHERMWHSGTTLGFRTVIDRFPKDQVTVMVLANRTDLDPVKLALQAADLLLTK